MKVLTQTRRSASIILEDPSSTRGKDTVDGETGGGDGGGERLTLVSVRYKFWSCCCIKTVDFNSFLDQKGCSSGRHCWVTKKVQHLSHICPPPPPSSC